MNVLTNLAIILLILMVSIGGKKGARSFIALFFNFGVLFVMLTFMTNPTTNPIIVTLVACTLICCINLFFINRINVKTKTALLSTVLTVTLLLFFIVIITEKSKIQGFGEEELLELSIFSLYVGVDFMRIGASMIIMSTIGAIIDVSISITSPMYEIYMQHPTINRKDLFLVGLRIGQDILATSANTLFFAFFGGYLALLIMYKDFNYTFGEIINSKIFSAEIITIFSAGIGVALIIPITSWITTYFLTKSK